MIIETFSQKETMKIGEDIAKNAKAGEIYCLTGDIGAGKTHFAKGFAKGLMIKDDITSPTFTIVDEHREGNIPFFHFDVYRINSITEMIDIGYEEYFFSDGVCLIEWADMIEDIVPKNAIWINIKKNLENGEEYRIIEVIR